MSAWLRTGQGLLPPVLRRVVGLVRKEGIQMLRDPSSLLIGVILPLVLLFLFALVLTGPDTQTMPIGVSAFIGTVSVNWGGSSAAAVIAMLPMFVIGLLIQRFLVRGLAMGAVKG